MKNKVYEKIKDDLPENLRKDIEKFGLENFEFEVLDTASSQEELDKKQREYVKEYNSLEPKGYNLPGGIGEEEGESKRIRIIKQGNRGSTIDALTFFRDHHQKLGRVRYIVLYEAEKEWLINHDLYHEYIIVIGERVQLWMSGLTWGYYGTGPSGLHEMLQMIDPGFTYEQVVGMEKVPRDPIVLEFINGTLIQKSFDEPVRSLITVDEGRLPWRKLWSD